MREDFCAFILTHGRPNNVVTYRTLQAAGYTGKVFIVIDDEDETTEEYKRIYGDDVWCSPRTRSGGIPTSTTTPQIGAVSSGRGTPAGT